MREGRQVLICGVNWLGDSCMSMPAIQAWKEQNQDHQITLLTKAPLVPLWQCHAAIDRIITLAPGNIGPIKTGLALRQEKLEAAYIFPNSWRAALPPWIARTAQRTGFAGHSRAWMLTQTIPDAPDSEHQQWEYARILGLPATTSLPMPEIHLPEPPAQVAGIRAPLIGILPGAARGPAKRWPMEHFIAAARHLRKAQDFHFLIMGTPAEAALCQQIAQTLEPNALCLAGVTTLPAFAASLRACHGVLSNDSGGMHIAAAVGTPVTAMFGLTNPAKTGPIGPYTRCLQPAGITGARKIARASEAAERVLAAITPEEAALALLDLMRRKGSLT
jgi:heptosyltransferase II